MDYFSLMKSRPDLFENNNALIRVLTNEDEIRGWRENYLEKLAKKHQPATWADIGNVFDDPRLVILRDLVEFPGGFRNGYPRLYNRAYLEGGAAGVVILPVMNGELLVMHQFRHATRSWHWEIPRGFGEPGITAEDQARAEIMEEISGEIAVLTNLGLYFSNTGLEGNPITLFLAYLKSVGKSEEGGKIETLRWISIPEFEKMIADGDITDGFTIAAYTKAKLKRLI